MITTAKEAIERSNDINKQLGQTYGRLQSELLNPLIKAAAKQISPELIADLEIDLITSGQCATRVVDGKIERVPLENIYKKDEE